MRFTKFATAVLVDDVATARDFLVAHVGMKVTVDLGWYVDFGHESDPSFTFDLIQSDHESTPAALRGRSVAGTFLALMVEDAKAEEDRLREAGAEIIAECVDEPWGQRHFFAAVPGGLVLDILQMIEPDPAWLAANGL
ncbi:Glyoxalase/Bleomycin resistance protein/dioxygenase domain [Alloactinosynnema sp. L-07]|uniref:VOC family protein n=1 Tax=Alloactinosynnema sp. L-07 TaxID=1653480 RepID=UPI00065F0850|nr:VOC family protein [Alloactinosynnema sp. L-07]CRK58974.1 Glyoxalase/Bleomycin resistance protein/dioxygenase domain [Alloactinosynnema sp. L-07]